MTPKRDALHVCKHVPPQHQAVAELLAEPLNQKQIAERLGWTHRMVEQSVVVIKDALALTEDRGIWRVEYVRQFYGIDPCWCQRDG